MKKITLVLVVLLAAAPAMAVVDINAVQVGDTNEVDIIVSWSGEGSIPRAFALDVNVGGGKSITGISNYHTGESRPGNKGYGIFPASFARVMDANFDNWDDANYTPVADVNDLPGDTLGGIGTSGITIEMGSLYVGGPNAPTSPVTIARIALSGSCTVCFDLNIGRAGIVLVDGNAPGSNNLPYCKTITVVEICTVPDVVGWTSELAQAAIIAAGFDIGDITVEISETIADGNVISTDPPEGPASCNPASVNILVSVGPGDLGDASDGPYPTLMTGGRNGARHKAVGVMLGVARDTEVPGHQSANCDGDDLAVTDDEDGITNLVATLTAGTVDVTVSAACYLNAWIDFTDDGDWDDAGEQIFTNYNIAGAGTYNLPFTVVGAVKNTDLVSRWRVTDVAMAVSAYTGLELTGEVEDYNDLKICHVPDVVGDANAAAQAALDANGFTVNVIGECNDVIAAGIVIRTNPAYCNYPGCDTAVDMVVSTGSCECFPSDHPDYAMWLKAGSPPCWCNEFQCKGDADGGFGGKNVYGQRKWVTLADADIFNAAWQHVDDATWAANPSWICADYDHGFGGKDVNGQRKWVTLADADIFNAGWQVVDSNAVFTTNPCFP